MATFAERLEDLRDLFVVNLPDSRRVPKENRAVDVLDDMAAEVDTLEAFRKAPVAPSYTVANLPATATAGQLAYASNGRKGAEGIGAGTGVLVFYDGSAWIAVDSGAAVAA